ncbi:MAG TPA: hypothetical protein VKA87_06140 [Nitrososphaeraceae archaeon]|nr:hypothetical protein [Nitrososphaeraceae archaeon]
MAWAIPGNRLRRVKSFINVLIDGNTHTLSEWYEYEKKNEGTLTRNA